MEHYESMGVVAAALYGDVFKLRDRRTGELLALKRLDLEAAASRRTRDSHRRIDEDVFAEVQTNLAIRRRGGHPCIVAMRECFSDDTTLSLVTEWCEQGELLQVVNARGSKLSVIDAMRFFHEIVQGVAFLHANGIAHRDLSLENVLVDADNHCKIADFGMATSATCVRATGIGKIHYMAPEACRFEDFNPFEADMWALGVILLTMLTGQYPFQHALDSDSHFRLLSTFGVEYLLERCGFETTGYEDIVDVLKRLLVVDPSLRATADELIFHECFDVFRVEDLDACFDLDTDSDIESITSEDDSYDTNPADDEDEDDVPTPNCDLVACGVQSSQVVQRRPAPINTGTSCTVVAASNKSPHVLKQQREAAADRPSLPKLSDLTGPRRSPMALRRVPGPGSKKCVFRGMLDGVFQRKKARTSMAVAPSNSARCRR